MKTLLSTVLLIAVSAWGQSKPATSKAGKCVTCSSVDVHDCTLQPCPTKPHKPKPSMDKERAEVMEWIRKDCEDKGGSFMPMDSGGTCSNMGEMPHHITSYADPCDGWACTKPVDVIKQNPHQCKGADDEGYSTFDADGYCLAGCQTKDGHLLQRMIDPKPCTNPNDEGCGIVNTFQQSVDHEYGSGSGVGWQPDKAAVPVEPKMPNYEEWEADKRGLESCLNNKGTCEYINISATALASVVGGTDGSKMVKLSDSEYSHLQQLRTSVVEEEKRLAFKYGACVPYPWQPKQNNANDGDDDPVRCHVGDHYEYKGQFLLIDKGGK